jgi:polo-like kinase 4
MVLYSPAARCTLMANEPLGDIELLFHCLNTPSLPDPTSNKNSSYLQSNMRIRFSRHSRSVEVSRFVSMSPSTAGKNQGEWTKKVFPCVTGEKLLEIEILDDKEREGVTVLMTFLRLCETAEAIETARNDIPARFCDDLPTAKSLWNSLVDQAKRSSSLVGRESQTSTPSSATIATPLASLELLPRPSKLSYSGSLRRPRKDLASTMTTGLSCAPNLTPNSSLDA